MPTIRQRLGAVGAAFRNLTSPENPSVPLSALAKWLNAGTETVAGEAVNEVISLQVTTVMTCTKILAESVASLPCVLYETDEKGVRKEADGHPLHYVLGVEPNDEMSAFTFWETLAGCAALTGNGYAEISWTKSNQVGELYPLNPLITEPFRKENGELAYKTRQGVKQGPGDAVNTMKFREIDAKNILHIRLWSFTGIKGMSPISEARQTIGLARAAEKFGARFFGNGSKPGGVLTYKANGEDDDGPGDKEMQEIRQAWEASQGGSNQGRTAVLPGGWDYQQIGLSPEDSQFLQTRGYTRDDIAALFRVPAHMVGNNQKISNNSYEQMNLSFVNDTVRPILMRIEAEINRKLLPKAGQKAYRYVAEFDLTERLRADHETTMKGVALGRQWGLLGVDEGRIAMGMNPINDNSRIVPINMMNAELIPDQDTIPGAPGPQDSYAADADNNAPKNKTKKPKAAGSGLSDDEDEAEEVDLEV